MKRRTFLQKSSLLAAAPFLLPSGRLFAKTASRRVNHVVFCLYAGGVRNIESVHQNEGNLMPALLEGAASTIPGLESMPASPFAQPLAKMGTLFKEFRYKEGPTGHFNGHTVAVTGRYTSTGLNLKQNPEYPTIFEYYLKHNSPVQTATNAWWVSNALGPYPALNYSRHPDYGPLYGANHIAPTRLISQEAYPAIGTPKQFHAQEEEAVGKVRDFLNKNFDKQAGQLGLGINNEAGESQADRRFLSKA